MVRSFSLSRDDDVVVTCSEFFPVSHALPTALSRNAPQLWASISGRGVGLRCMHPPRHCDCTCCYSTCGPECGGEDSHPRVCQRPVTCGAGMVSRGPQEALRGDRARDRRSKDPQRGRQITRRERRKGLLSATTSRDRGWLGDQVFAWLARSNTQVSGGSVLVPEHRHHGETP